MIMLKMIGGTILLTISLIFEATDIVMKPYLSLLIIVLLSTAACKKKEQPVTAKLTSADSIRLYYVPGHTEGVGYHYMLTRGQLKVDTTASAFQPDYPYTFHITKSDADHNRLAYLLDNVPERISYTENAKYVDAFNCVDGAVVYIEAYQGGKGHTWVADECTDDMHADGKKFTDEVFSLLSSL